MNYLRRRLNEDPYNIELRRYYLIELILNEKWLDLLDILEETPQIHLHLTEFAFKYFPLTNERIEKIKQRLKSFQIALPGMKFVKKSFEYYRNEIESSSSSSSLSSIESFHQSILFLSKAKFYKKYSHWIEFGKGECEMIENNQTGEIFLRFWISKNSSINLVLLVNLHQSEHFSLLSKNYSSFIVKFQAKNQCDYPISNDLTLYKLKFYAMMDVIQFKDLLTLREKNISSHP